MACVTNVIEILCLFILFVVVASRPDTGKNFDVRTYGAKGDGITDSANAFMKAWKDACAQSGSSRIYIPRETFYMSDVSFKGPCKGKIVFFLSGTLLSPVNANKFKQEAWIDFQYVDNLVISGGGTIDGQGSHSWSSNMNDCGAGAMNRRRTPNMKFHSVTNSSLIGLKSLNSKSEHLSIYRVDHFNITGVNITAPGNSPNTDGIKIGHSKNMKIWDSHIGTGDDCIAILSGNSNFDIHNITCGPGHGISVGSLGRNKEEKNVEGFRVRDTVFTGTSDGIRLKTWESSVSEITVSQLLYENIQMVDVKYPINIEQNYCPCPPCPKLGDSHVQIRNVTLKNIWGTSRNKVAVKMHCSKTFPCKDIQLIDINITHNGPGGPATALCENVRGSARGKMVPPSCFK
ncbi:hypothetical protein EUTSA_v10009641mg [Eutrema salsugineum]|uniref:Pectate lyase superfamily protein domain-containing protein n=1 Tax=Eutrema salsugineum TaxID=72664 RepID=V4KYK4_EUTSA|nr:exopolygalacturonase [Eutrema salsugineum]ESQ35087.1 hypothetical protein EUTSA_v10009641mg [Eutrema salsugineum]